MGDIADLYNENFDFYEDAMAEPTTCRYCRREIEWRQTENGWRPFTTAGLHRCKQFLKTRQVTVNDFAVIDGTVSQQ
jgi:hypothetical protein